VRRHRARRPPSHDTRTVFHVQSDIESFDFPRPGVPTSRFRRARSRGSDARCRRARSRTVGARSRRPRLAPARSRHVLEMTEMNQRFGVAEREGFEPPIGLHLCRISSAVHSTTLPPLLKAPKSRRGAVRGRGRVLGEDGGPDKRTADKIGGRNRKASEKGSWDRHTQAQIGGPMPPMPTPGGFGFRRPAPAALGKLAMARMAATRTRFKPYRSRLPSSRGRPARRNPSGLRTAAAPSGTCDGTRPCQRQNNAKPFIFGRFLPRFALTPG
jgi:hypothetical protein